MNHYQITIDVHAENDICWQFVEHIYELMQDFGDFAFETNVRVNFDV